MKENFTRESRGLVRGRGVTALSCGGSTRRAAPRAGNPPFACDLERRSATIFWGGDEKTQSLRRREGITGQAATQKRYIRLRIFSHVLSVEEMLYKGRDSGGKLKDRGGEKLPVPSSLNGLVVKTSVDTRESGAKSHMWGRTPASSGGSSSEVLQTVAGSW